MWLCGCISCNEILRYIYRSHAHLHFAFVHHTNLSHQTISFQTNQSLTRNMHSIFGYLLQICLSSAMPMPPSQTTLTGPFVLRAFQPASPIHQVSLNANGGYFWLGKPTSSSCTAQPEGHCPKGTRTALMVSSRGSATLVGLSNSMLDLLLTSSNAGRQYPRWPKTLRR